MKGFLGPGGGCKEVMGAKLVVVAPRGGGGVAQGLGQGGGGVVGPPQPTLQPSPEDKQGAVKILLPSASPPRKESTPSNTHPK